MNINLDKERRKILRLYLYLNQKFDGLIKSYNQIAGKDNDFPTIKFIYDYSLNSIIMYDGTETLSYSDTSLKDQIITDLFERIISNKKMKAMEQKNDKVFLMYKRAKESQNRGETMYDIR